MQRNMNWQLLMASVLMLAASTTGCQGTGRQVETPALPSAQFRPAADERAYAAFPATKINRLPETANARQATCPVTGARLGSMGDPVPVEVDGRTVYVCCAECVEMLRENPEKYLRGNQPATEPGAASYDEYPFRDLGRTSSNSSACGPSCCH